MSEETNYPTLPDRVAEPVVPIPTAESAQAAVDATLDSADEADMRELTTHTGDIAPGSNEENAEANRANAITADELAVKRAEEDLDAELEKALDTVLDQALASPEIDAMINAALEDEDPSESQKEVIHSLAQRVRVLEGKMAAFDTLLNEFKERALAAFKHAGFKF